LPAEGYHTGTKFTNEFLHQFGTVITVQRNLKTKNVVYWQHATPWFTEKFIDLLLTYTYPIYYGCPDLNKYFPEKALIRNGYK
jgi:hypothetical protein